MQEINVNLLNPPGENIHPQFDYDEAHRQSFEIGTVKGAVLLNQYDISAYEYRSIGPVEPVSVCVELQDIPESDIPLWRVELTYGEQKFIGKSVAVPDRVAISRTGADTIYIDTYVPVTEEPAEPQLLLWPNNPDVISQIKVRIFKEELA